MFQVVSICPEVKQIVMADKSTLLYKHLVIATGGKYVYDYILNICICTRFFPSSLYVSICHIIYRPRVLTCRGSDLDNICYLRTPDDGKKLASLIKGKHVVVIGSSFIGKNCSYIDLLALCKQQFEVFFCLCKLLLRNCWLRTVFKNESLMRANVFAT